MEMKMENDPVNTEVKTKVLPVKQTKTSSIKSAKERAEEIRKHLGNMDKGTDDFFVDPDTIPDGWTYEWKRYSIYNQEDPSYQVELRRMGWMPVPSSRHPEMMPVNYKDDVILRKGMLLMERPEEITDEIRAIDRKEARDQVRMKEKQLNDAPNGQFERVNKDKPLAKIKKSYEAMPIPED